MAKVQGVKKKYNADDVSQPVPEYDAFMALLELPHTLLGGTQAMRKAGKKYLPKEEGEDEESYRNRLARSFLLNAFRRTVQKLTGEVFSKEITAPQNENEEVSEWLEDIDLQKNKPTEFSSEVFADGITDGIVHVLVDLPAVKTFRGEDGKIYFDDKNEETGEVRQRLLTMEAMKEKGWRPYAVKIDAKSLIGWRTENRNGEDVLTQIRVYETSSEPEGKYGTKEVHRIRVIEENSWEVFILQKNSKGEEEWASEDSGEHNRGFIPLVTWSPGEAITEMTTKPPMEDLAHLNLSHWQSSSDQRNILHFARMITYFGKMLDLGNRDNAEDKSKAASKAIIGANVLIHSSDEAGDLKVVEHTGAAIEAGRNDLKDIEVQMRAYGLGLVMGSQPGQMTATAKAIDTAESDSTLKSWAVSYELFFNRVIHTMGRVGGIEDVQTGYQINTDFKSFLRSMEVKELREAFIDGLLPREVVFEEYKRRGLVKEELEFAEVMDMLQKEQQDRANMAFGAGRGFWGSNNPDSGTGNA